MKCELETSAAHELTIQIGGMPIIVRTGDSGFASLLERRYGSFAGSPESKIENRKSKIAGDIKTESRQSNISDPVFELDVELAPAGDITDEADVSVRLESGRWVMERGDFRAEWDPESRRGRVRQTANPYSIDCVLRILHSLVLAREGGFLVHGASAVRNGRAFIFAGVSGAGKTTIARLAPPDVLLLTDEISYVRPRERFEVPGDGEQGIRSGVTADRETRTDQREGILPSVSSGPLFPAYEAFGTPFAGELARVGENIRAPLAALYLLAQGPENRVEPLSNAEATRGLMRNVLFFAREPALTEKVFESVVDFVSQVPVSRLVFAPDPRVWELIGS